MDWRDEKLASAMASMTGIKDISALSGLTNPPVEFVKELWK